MWNFKSKKHMDDSKLAGNIYVFTFSHFITYKKVAPENLRLVDARLLERPKIGTSNEFDAKKNVLIKVGYTRQTPLKRLQQWRNACGQQDFVLLTPGMEFPVKKKSLSKLFSNLKIKDKKYNNINHLGDAFWSKNAYKSEQKIHRIIKERYGCGRMFCDGCKMSPKKQGIHHEWFCIPRTSMDDVWRIIDSQCA